MKTHFYPVTTTRPPSQPHSSLLSLCLSIHFFFHGGVSCAMDDYTEMVTTWEESDEEENDSEEHQWKLIKNELLSLIEVRLNPKVREICFPLNLGVREKSILLKSIQKYI